MQGRRLLARLAAGLLILGVFGSATARADVDLDVLLDFDVVIADDGDYYDGWDADDNRVYARVDDRGHLREHYFSDIASAFYVLHERYGDPVRMRELRVPEYGGHGMLDATQAWYFWDSERQARGGMPLILAFYDPRDVREMSYRWRGEVMDFGEVSARLRSWCGGGSQRIYWRGADRWDDRTWNSAWNRRWDGWCVDASNGWLHMLLGGGWDRPGRPGRDSHAGHGYREGRNNDRHWRDNEGPGRHDRWNDHRERGRDRGEDRRWRDRGESGRDRDRGRDDNRERDHDERDRDRDRDRVRNASDVVKGTNDPQPQG
jgi:hypothetical protein